MIEWIAFILLIIITFGGFFILQQQYEKSMKEGEEQFFKITGRYPPKYRSKRKFRQGNPWRKL